MSLQLPPQGTHGSDPSRLARRIMKMTSGLGSLMFRFGMKIQGRPLLELVTVGARTDRSRKTVLAWFPDDTMPDSWVVVGSNAGASRHPGWAHNLARHPDRATVDTGDGPLPVSAQMLTDGDRSRMWHRVVEMAPAYGRYETGTDREIPLFRLTLAK